MTVLTFQGQFKELDRIIWTIARFVFLVCESSAELLTFFCILGILELVLNSACCHICKIQGYREGTIVHLSFSILCQILRKTLYSWKLQLSVFM